MAPSCRYCQESKHQTFAVTCTTLTWHHVTLVRSIILVWWLNWPHLSFIVRCWIRIGGGDFLALLDQFVGKHGKNAKIPLIPKQNKKHISTSVLQHISTLECYFNSRLAKVWSRTVECGHSLESSGWRGGPDQTDWIHIVWYILKTHIIDVDRQDDCVSFTRMVDVPRYISIPCSWGLDQQISMWDIKLASCAYKKHLYNINIPLGFALHRGRPVHNAQIVACLLVLGEQQRILVDQVEWNRGRPNLEQNPRFSSTMDQGQIYRYGRCGHIAFGLALRTLCEWWVHHCILIQIQSGYMQKT